MTHADDITLLRDSAQRFSEARRDTGAVRARRRRLPGYDTALLDAMADLGWFGILVPEDLGGLGLGFAEMAVVVENLGRNLLAEPIVPIFGLGVRALLHSDNAALKKSLLPYACSGTARPCLAWQEENGGLDPAHPQTTVAGADGALTLNGRKRFVAGVGAATGFLITASGNDGVGLYWIDRDAPGFGLDYEWRSDGTPSGVVTLHDVPVSAVAASPAVALTAVRRACDEAAVLAGAELLGVMHAVLDMTLEYMRTRVQFDRPIGSFQALQHRAVDLAILRHVCESIVDDAVDVLDAPASPEIDRRLIASRTKARTSDAGLRIAREAIQLHGAIGFTEEYDLSLYVKRAMVLSAWLGNGAMHRRQFEQLYEPK